MNINLTLVGEFITFGLFVFVTMKFIWPMLTKVMDERQKRIADGLQAAERGQKSLELAQQNISQQLKDVKQEAEGMITTAKQQQAKIIEEAKAKASSEGKKLLELARGDIARETEAAKAELKSDISALVLRTTEKILQSNIDKAANAKLIDKFISELENGGK